jgi:hypothetical protein
VTAAIEDPIDGYLELGLRLGRHLDGLVDAYYGPEELRGRVADEPLRSLPALGDDAGRLIARLDSGVDDLGPTRRRWVRAQVVGLHTTARKLAGEPIDFADEVAWCYGVRPRRLDEDEFEHAHRTLATVLPGSGGLRDRYVDWRERHAIPSDRLREALDAVVEMLRDETARRIGLPDGEQVAWELVHDKPWSGFNYYEGDLHSRVAINTDLPVLSLQLPHLVAHEAYPGHHTEHCRKEIGLVRRRREVEETIFLVGTPQCLLAEGLADLALEALVGDRPETHVAPLFADLGLPYDGDTATAVREAGEVLGAVRQNAAFLLHADGVPPEEVVAYMERWAMLPRDRAVKAVAFLTDPTWRAYISCYVEGLPLCRAFVAGDPHRFLRLLDEHLVPDDLHTPPRAGA